MAPLHPINLVVQRTGLSAHVIRAWERRYGAIKPTRTASHRREYTSEDIERLLLLRQLTASGHSISRLAAQPTDELRRLAEDLAPVKPGPEAATPDDFVRGCIEAVRQLDAPALHRTLTAAETEFGMQGALQRVVGPMAELVGEHWRSGVLTAAHEHFASAVLRTHLGQLTRTFGGTDNAPAIIVATPAGQLHELGALIAGALAANLGWRVIYLGASLPPVEIAAAARQQRARAVGLSLVYPEDDPQLETELKRLRELLPTDVRVIVGGRAAAAYAPILRQIGAAEPTSLEHFGRLLDELRRPAGSPAS